MCGSSIFNLATFATGVLAATESQVPLRPENVFGTGEANIGKSRTLHGRFLHVTDFHPDRFYQVYASTAQDAACHRGQGPAGLYGAETSECDSPVALINRTMEWIHDELKDKIDFVIWTGDSARHDNDEEIPRNAEQVVGFNEFMVQKMYEVFGKHNGDEDDDDPNNDFVIPIVPSFGNNDILPHNVMTRGPNTWTRTYARVWRQFIPEAQKHQFEQGGWFYVEVIPNELAVFSLNSLFWASNNAAVDGCAAPREPGYQQLEWLRIQLQFMRDRGVKAILTAHQPPIRQSAKELWDETCWQKYALWLRQYRDVIVSSHFGHFNFDHFLLQDFKDLDKDTKNGRMNYYHAESGDDFETVVSSDYWMQLRDQWSELPKPPKSMRVSELSEGDDGEDSSDGTSLKKGKDSKKEKARKERKKYLKKMGGQHAERFSASFISASIVPNLFPTLRIFEYNITGLDKHKTYGSESVPPAAYVSTSEYDVDKTRKKKKKERKHKFTIPEPPSKSAGPGPAYSPQSLSLLKYTQYFANITHINNDFHSDSDAQKWKDGKHAGRKPHNKDHEPQPKKFKFEVLYDTQDDKVYKLKDLTMPNLVDLARRIGNFKPATVKLVDEEMDDFSSEDLEAVKKGHKKRKHHRKHGKSARRTKQNMPWYTFMDRAFVATKTSDELEEEFGY
ncbi:Endopolyphosphatase [Recurvomyces mirabilis]|uniref:Endopolyphosphatase n=1 Tax=Recurvomyces mirabilis TaxID=574656 RepID=A0AAE0TRP2_9PEZI|nr:Endopolyphosphatase [Recurvomyces mirabilis]